MYPSSHVEKSSNCCIITYSNVDISIGVGVLQTSGGGSFFPHEWQETSHYSLDAESVYCPTEIRFAYQIVVTPPPPNHLAPTSMEQYNVLYSKQNWIKLGSSTEARKSNRLSRCQIYSLASLDRCLYATLPRATLLSSCFQTP